MRSPRRTAVSITAMLYLSACLGSPTGDPGSAPVVGQWSYSAQQNAGTPASLAGAIVFTGSTATSYGGSFDVIESVVGNQQRRLVGAVSGRMSSSNSADFSVALGADQRQHIGTLVDDTLSGTWFQLGPDNAVIAGGSFRAIRSK